MKRCPCRRASLIIFDCSWGGESKATHPLVSKAAPSKPSLPHVGIIACTCSDGAHGCWPPAGSPTRCRNQRRGHKTRRQRCLNLNLISGFLMLGLGFLFPDLFQIRSTRHIYEQQMKSLESHATSCSTPFALVPFYTNTNRSRTHSLCLLFNGKSHISIPSPLRST